VRVAPSLPLLAAALAACHAGGPGPRSLAPRCAPDRIGAVTVEGAPRAALAPLTVLEGTLDDPARTDRITELALEGLRAQGHAKATLTVTRSEGCGVELHAVAKLGPKFTIDKIAFETDADDELTDAQRLRVIEDGLGTVNTIGGTYIAYRLQRGLAELKKRYADAGWVGAVISAPRAVYDDRGNVTISIAVRSGPRFTIGTIRAIGAGASSRAIVLEAMGLREGAYYDRALVRAGVERAQRVLDRRIQLRVQVAPERTEIDVDAIVEAP
jgi:outer membrane protein assembly factor BamA